MLIYEVYSYAILLLTLRLHHVFFLERVSDGGPEKGPLILDVPIRLYLRSSGWVGPFQGHHHSLKKEYMV